MIIINDESRNTKEVSLLLLVLLSRFPTKFAGCICINGPNSIPYLNIHFLKFIEETAEFLLVDQN